MNGEKTKYGTCQPSKNYWGWNKYIKFTPDTRSIFDAHSLSMPIFIFNSLFYIKGIICCHGCDEKRWKAALMVFKNYNMKSTRKGNGILFSFLTLDEVIPISWWSHCDTMSYANAILLRWKNMIWFIKRSYFFAFRCGEEFEIKMLL